MFMQWLLEGAGIGVTMTSIAPISYNVTHPSERSISFIAHRFVAYQFSVEAEFHYAAVTQGVERSASTSVNLLVSRQVQYVLLKG
jgi:hypothetical protein